MILDNIGKLAVDTYSFAVQGMQLAPVSTAAGVGGVGGAILTSIIRLVATPLGPPVAPVHSSRPDPAHDWASAVCSCPSLFEHIEQLLSSYGPPLPWLVVCFLLLAAGVLGLICGVLVGLGVASALGLFRAPRIFPSARDRVAAYRH